MFKCSIVLLFYCSIVQLFNCSIVSGSGGFGVSNFISRYAELIEVSRRAVFHALRAFQSR